MTLTEEVRAERKRMAANPEHAHLSDDIIALCRVLERREQIALQNGQAVTSNLRDRDIRLIPKRYADGVEPALTARAKEDAY